MAREAGHHPVRGLVIVLAGALLAPAPALAQSAPAESGSPATPPAAPGFTLQPVDGGVLKLDTRSGAMSFCSLKAGAWLCEAVPEDRAALEAEIDRLHARIATLEGRGQSGVPDIMAPPAPPGALPGPSPDSPASTPEPGEARKRLDEALDVAEHAFRRFMEMVERLRREESATPEKL